jgi:glycosyltransferase involved in cell wall biosynthesis
MDIEPSERQIERAAPDALVGEVRDACAELGLGRVTVAVPFAIGEESAKALLALPEVAAIVLAAENSALATQFPKRVGWVYAKRHRWWRLPKNSARHMLFLGNRGDFSFGMGLQAFIHGIFLSYFETPFGWSRSQTATVVALRILRILVIEQFGNGVHLKIGFIRKIFGGIRTSSRVQWIRKNLQPVIWDLAERNFNAAIENLLHHETKALLTRDEFVPGRIVLVNSALAWGGAERQLVNTALGLAGRGMADVTILCENSANVPDHDFFLWKLRESSVKISDLKRHAMESHIYSPMKELAPLFHRVEGLSLSLKDDIGFLMREFLERRPEIVHAWQDQTSIKVGIAAALVGVPKIVLSARNLAAYRFYYHLPYMRWGYRAISRRENVVLLNNSRAGAADYAAWLDIPVERFRVLPNGFAPGHFVSADDGEIGDFRRRLGLPDGVRIVGSVFRFYEEKDPLLWVRTAARIARARPDVIFLLIGTGKMLSEMSELAAKHGIADRIFLPGVERHPGLAYSVMDVVLLTSHLEGLPNVLIEAQALGVPVVATDAGGCREAVLDGETGVIVKSRDPANLAERVLHILDDQDWSAKARQRGPAFVSERFGIERMIEETLKVYGVEAPDRPAPARPGPG